MPEKNRDNHINEDARFCKICSSSISTLVFKSYRGDVRRCINCGLYWVEDNGKTPYDQESLFYSTIQENSYVDYFEPFRKKQYRYVLEKLKLDEGDSLLDVGASYGWSVEVGLAMGLDAYGIEPGDAKCKESISTRISRQSLSSFSKKDRKFKVVTIWHVLEHLKDPDLAITQLKGLVDDNGYLLIAVPTTDGLMFRLGLLLKKFFCYSKLLNECFYFHNPNMHCYYYNLNSLTKLLRKAGLNPYKIETIDSADWKKMYKRLETPLGRFLFRVAGPIMDKIGFTKQENLIVVACKDRK